MKLEISAIIYVILTLPFRIAFADFPICVVGGGLGGLRLSKLLQDKGQDVILFEASRNFGGKMETFRDKARNIILEKGPLVFTPGEKRLRALIKQHGLTENTSGLKKRVAFDQIEGVLADILTPTPKERQEFFKAYTKYTQLWNKRRHLLQKGYIHPDLETSDLSVPILTWLEDHDLLPLTSYLRIMTTAGFGSLEQTPALYLLQFLDPDFFVSTNDTLESEAYTTNEGFDKLVQGMATEINVKYVRREVVKIERSSSENVILHFKNLDSEPRRCSKVILTFTPLLSTLLQMIGDLSAEELQVLNQIKVSKYASAGVIIEKWRMQEGTGFLGILDSKTGKVTSPFGKGESAVMLKITKSTRSDIFSVHSLIRGEFDEGPTKADLTLMDTKLKVLLRNIRKSRSKRHCTGKDDILIGPQGYEHFPRVSGSSIREGFYRKFRAIQGNGGIYYATPLLSFDMMEPVLEMVEDFLEEYF